LYRIESVAVGVGQYPDSFSVVRGIKVGRSIHSPRRIKPQRGQVSKDSSKSANNKVWRIFHEHETGSSFANHSHHLSPESAARPFDSFDFAGRGCRDVLAREATADDVCFASPRVAIEGLHIVPDWEARQDSVPLPLQEHGAAVWIEFDGADRTMAEYDSTEDSSPDSSK